MSIVVIDGLNIRTNSDIVKNFCQNFGRVINCYIKSNQCLVTFANKNQAEEFIRCSPHRIDSNGPVNATWKTILNQNISTQKRSLTTATTTTDLNNICRLTIRGTLEQLEEKNLIRYFSRFGHVRMCVSNQSQGFATITFDDRISSVRALNESKHFLNGRSLIVEPYEINTNKRIKTSDTNLTSQYEYEKEQLINEKQKLENQYQERIQLYEYEKQQYNNYLVKQQNEFQQQIIHYQYLLKQSLDELTNKDKQIEQLKQENKDIDDLLRQSVHDNEQQQIHLRKREDIHNQTKRKYEELYKAYMKLKDNCSIQTDKDRDLISQPNFIFNKPKPTIDNVKKKL